MRADTWVETGTEVTPHYDSLLAKLMVHAPDRAGATAALQKALAATELGGIATNLDYVAAIAGSQGFAAGVITRALPASPRAEVCIYLAPAWTTWSSLLAAGLCRWCTLDTLHAHSTQFTLVFTS